MSEIWIRQLLRTLAKGDASIEAGPGVEMQLRSKFRSRRRRRALRRVTLITTAAAAVLLVFVLLTRKPSIAPNVSGTAVHPQTVIASPADESEEIVTDFFPLMDPVPPFQRGQLLRVELPASALQILGLSVHEE